MAVVVALAVVVYLVVARTGSREGARDDAARIAAEKTAAAWQAGDLGGAPVADTGAVQSAYAETVAGLGDVTPDRVEVTDVERDEATATASLDVSWPLPGGEHWDYTTELPLTGDLATAEAGTWTAQLDATVVHPDLEPGDGVEAVRTRGERGDVLGRDGRPLVTGRPVVEVGVRPSAAGDADALAADLADVLDIGAGDLAARVGAAAPDAFVPVITLRRGDFEPVAARLRALQGVVLRESTLPLAPTREFARSLLGSVGEVDAEAVDASDGRLVAGDSAGTSGLQEQYDERLAGAAGLTVRTVPAADSGREAQDLFTVEPTDGQDVATSLDVATQRAADAALAGSDAGNGNASLVAVSVSTGDVLAVANTPAGGSNLALTGQYPPGSTFKAVSTLALLGTGLTPQQQVPCPETATVDGRSYGNAGGFVLGDVPFRQDFAQSCNTAFVGLSTRLAAGDLRSAAASVGLGGDWTVGVPAFTGDVPVAESDVERASATIGQGRVLASPLAMAQVAATIAGGTWTPPRLVTEPAPEASGDPPTPDADRLATVSDLMRLVATEGSAEALADVPTPGDAPVHAKTGTAQYGTDDPPRTHAWTIGFAGDVAFAVIVEDGDSGAGAAVPVVAEFLGRLAR